MEALSNAMLELIKKDLPSQTADALRQFIDNANKESEALAQSRKKNEELESRLNLLESERSKYESAISILADANKTKEANNEKGRDLAISIKDQQIYALTEIKNAQFKIMELFVKNPRSIEIMNHSWSESQNGYF